MTFFSDRPRDVAIATNFRVKIGQIGLLTFIRSRGIPKRFGNRNSDSKRFMPRVLYVLLMFFLYF